MSNYTFTPTQITQLAPSPAFWGEMSSIIANLRPYLGEAVTLLAKEAHGFPAVLAVDFEILHGYLFPTLQSKTSRVSSTLAAYVIENYPHKLVLPPGTLVELLSYTRRTFPILDQLVFLKTMLAKTTQRSHLDEYHLSLAITLLSRMSGDDSEIAIKSNEPEEVVATISQVLADVNRGFSRLRDLYGASKVVPLDEISPEWASYCDQGADLLSMVFAQLSAVGDIRSSKRTLASNRNDARNVSNVLSLNAAARDGRIEPQGFQLLTETKPLLRLNLSDYGRDWAAAELVRRGAILRGVVDAKKDAWFTCRLGSAALHCAIREAYDNAHVAFTAAKSQFAEWERLNADLFEAHVESEGVSSRSLSGGGGGRVTEGLKRKLNELLSGPGRWYVKLRTVLRRESEERVSRNSAIAPHPEAELYIDSSSSWNHSGDVRHSETKRLPHFFSQVEVPRSDADIIPYFQIFGVVVRKKRRGDLFPCLEVEAISSATEERLARIREWSDQGLTTVEWDAASDIDATLTAIARVFSTDGIEGEIAVQFDFDENAWEVASEGESIPERYADTSEDNVVVERTEKIIANLPLNGEFPIRSLWRAPLPSSVSKGVLELPSALIIRSSLCDVRFNSPFGGGQGSSTVVLTALTAQLPFNAIREILSATNVWRWNSYLVEFVQTLIENMGGSDAV